MLTEETLEELLGLTKQERKLFTVRNSKKARRLIFNSSVKKGLEVVLIPAPPEYDEHVLELLALHAVLGLKRGVALVVLRKLGDFGIRHGV